MLCCYAFDMTNHRSTLPQNIKWNIGKTRTDEENRNLCFTFGYYFVDKTVKLRDSASDTLRLLSASVDSDLSFPPHHCPMLDMLYPVTAAEVTRVLSSSPAKSYTMDIIPTSLLLCCKVVFSEIIAHLANLSFAEGSFPTLFKHCLLYTSPSPRD